MRPLDTIHSVVQSTLDNSPLLGSRRQAMRRRIFVGVIMAMLGLAAAAIAQEERFDYQVRDDMFRAFGGNEAAFKNAMAKIDATLAANPDHAEALVWRGAGTYWKA